MSFGSRLRQLRSEQSLRQEDLAEIIGVHRATIGKYETDERFPDRETLECIADYFNVSVDYLLDRTDIRNVYDDSTIGDNKKSACLNNTCIEDEVVTIKELLNFIKKQRMSKEQGKG